LSKDINLAMTHFLPAIQELFISIRDFLFPHVCPGCDNPLADGEALCGNCHEQIRAKSEQFQTRHELPGIDAVSVLLPYDEFTRNLVHGLKYHGVRMLGNPLGALMAEKMQKNFALRQDTLLIPVPLHPEKRKERGYNQCEQLADGFSSFSGLKVTAGLIERTRHTGTQTALDPESRKLNVQGAFRIREPQALEGKQAVILDDVLTTGSTVMECARVLRECGLSEVIVCVVATPAVHDS
jgi:competence protein ComFC